VPAAPSGRGADLNIARPTPVRSVTASAPERRDGGRTAPSETADGEKEAEGGVALLEEIDED